MNPSVSDSDSSAGDGLALQERRTLIDFPDESDDDYDSDNDINFTERNAEVTFDGSLGYGDEHNDASDAAEGMAAGNKSKTWANRLLRRGQAKSASGEKKSNTLGGFKTPGFSRSRAESPKPPREHRHFHLKRNRPTKQEAKPAPEPLLRYRLCPYALPSLHEVHAHFGSELNSWGALPKGDVDDRNSKYSAVIAMHFQELAEVARTVNGSPRNREGRPDRRSSKPVVEGSLTWSPARRNSDPAKADGDVLSAIEQAKLELRRSEITSRLEEPAFSRSLPSGFVFASIDDPVFEAFVDEDDDLSSSRHDSREVDADFPDDTRYSFMSDIRSSIRTPPPSSKAKMPDSATMESAEATSQSSITSPTSTTRASRFRKLAQFRSKPNGSDDKSAPNADDPSSNNLRRTFTLADLQSKSGVPPGVDMAHKEDALSDEEFEKIFKCTRTHFKALPQWRRTMLKKEHGLF